MNRKNGGKNQEKKNENSKGHSRKSNFYHKLQKERIEKL